MGGNLVEAEIGTLQIAHKQAEFVTLLADHEAMVPGAKIGPRFGYSFYGSPYPRAQTERSTFRNKEQR